MRASRALRMSVSRGTVFAVAGLFAATFMVSAARAESDADLRAEVEALRRRVAELETRWARAPSRESAPAISSSPGVELSLYGFVTSEAAWETTSTDGDRFLNLIPFNAGKEGDNDFVMSANATRVGLELRSKPDVLDSLSARGLLEVDFDTGSGSPRIRHAYAELLDPSWELLFGQTWAVAAQLNPDTINNDNLFNLGNAYERLPQARLSRKVEMGAGRLRMEAGALKFFGDFDQGDVGDIALALQQPAGESYRIESTGLPIGQARIAWWPGDGDAYGALSVSGGLVKVEDDTGDTQRVSHWLAAGELVLPAWGPFQLSGEAFWGKAGAFNTGVGQTVMISDSGGNACAIESRGGFAQLAYRRTEELRMNLIFGVDDPENRACGRPVAIERNQTALANLFWRVRPALELAFEVQHLRTRWSEGSFNADDLRFTQAVYLHF